MAPQEPPKEAEKPAEHSPKSTDGIVKAPIEAGGDKLPEGAVFTEVKSDVDRSVTPAIVPRGQADKPSEARAEVPPAKPATETKPLPAADEPQLQPVKKPAKTLPEAHSSAGPIVAATIVFIILAALAYLAYAKSN